MTELRYTVGTLRDAGLEARWSRTSNGGPIIVARNPDADNVHQRETWWAVTGSMWKQMDENGIVEGFSNATVFADIFSISV